MYTPIFLFLLAYLLASFIYHTTSVTGCRKVEVRDRVSCGYSGISKKECLKDCHCCFDDNAYKSDAQCFFRGKKEKTETIISFSEATQRVLGYIDFTDSPSVPLISVHSSLGSIVSLICTTLITVLHAGCVEM